jgi:hypothetical protein
MKKYVLSASLSIMLASSAPAEGALQSRECRQSEGRLGRFAVSYTITIKDRERTEKSARDLDQACTRADCEEAPTVIAGFHDIAMVSQTIRQCGGHASPWQTHSRASSINRRRKSALTHVWNGRGCEVLVWC